MKSGLLKILRSNCNVSQKDFAKALGVSQQTIASWEVGRTEPSNDWLKVIADYFNVSIDPPLSDEHSSLLQKYDALADDGRQLIRTMLDSLLLSHPKHLPSDSNLK